MKNNRQTGKNAEDAVCRYLQTKGYRILEQNYRVRQGEIDIIASQGEYLVFLEVKYRKGKDCGLAVEAVDARKCRQIGKVALFYLASHDLPLEQDIRFDVVAVDGNRVRIIENAFEYTGRM